MFPGCNSPQDMKSEDYKKKWEASTCGIITIFPMMGMGPKLVLTMLYFLAVSFCLPYLATFALKPGANFLTVFRFVATAGVMTFLAVIVQHTIWFRNRIVSHMIESIAYAISTGAIFGLMWPAPCDEHGFLRTATQRAAAPLREEAFPAIG